jgi:hypothetical protein
MVPAGKFEDVGLTGPAAAKCIREEAKNWIAYDEYQQKMQDAELLHATGTAMCEEVRTNVTPAQEPAQEPIPAQKRRSNRLRIASLKARAQESKGPPPKAPPVKVTTKKKTGPTKRKVAAPAKNQKPPPAKIQKAPALAAPVRGLPGSQLRQDFADVDGRRITKDLLRDFDQSETDVTKMRQHVNKLFGKEEKLLNQSFWLKYMEKDPGRLARLVMVGLTHDECEKMGMQCLNQLTSRQQLDMALKFRAQALRHTTSARIYCNDLLIKMESKSWQITIPKEASKVLAASEKKVATAAGPKLEVAVEGPKLEGPKLEVPAAGPTVIDLADSPSPSDTGPKEEAGDTFVAQDHYIRSKQSRSGFKGVSYEPHRKTWRVKYQGSTIGRFDTQAAACQKYFDQKQAEKQVKEFEKREWYDDLSFDK